MVKKTEKKEEVKEVKEVEVKKKTVEFPEVRGSGKFQAVKVEDQYVVYNPDGLRVTDLLPLDKANDIVFAQNRAK